MTDNEIIKAKKLIKKLEEAYNAYYDTSKHMPYDIDETLRETAICLENLLAENNRQKAEIEAYKHYYNECLKDLENANAEIERLTNLCNEQNAEIKRLIEVKNRFLYNLKLVCEEKEMVGDAE